MNKAQIDFLLASGFEFVKAISGDIYRKQSKTIIAIICCTNPLSFGFLNNEITTYTLVDLKSIRKEIEQFERLCINLEALK